MAPVTCEWCGGEFTRARSTKRHCSAKCQQAHAREEKRKLEPLTLALIELGEEQRETEREEALQEDLRLTAAPRECRCNGSGIFDYDQEGRPVCVKCGGEVAAAPPGEGWSPMAGLRAAMRVDPCHEARDLSEEWRHARRAGEPEPPRVSVDPRCKIYRGEPDGAGWFKPVGAVVLARITGP